MSVYISSGSSKFVTESELQADLKRYSTNAYVDGLITPIESEITTLTTDVTNLQTRITQVIFQPGGATNPATNTFASWPALCTFVYNCNPNGAVNILLDVSNAPATVPSGTYNLPPFVTFTGMSKVGLPWGISLLIGAGVSFVFPQGVACLTFDGCTLHAMHATGTLATIARWAGSIDPSIVITNNGGIQVGAPQFLLPGQTLFDITCPINILLNNGSEVFANTYMSAFTLTTGFQTTITVNDTSKLDQYAFTINAGLSDAVLVVDIAAFVDPTILASLSISPTYSSVTATRLNLVNNGTLVNISTNSSTTS